MPYIPILERSRVGRRLWVVEEESGNTFGVTNCNKLLIKRNFRSVPMENTSCPGSILNQGQNLWSYSNSPTMLHGQRVGFMPTPR